MASIQKTLAAQPQPLHTPDSIQASVFADVREYLTNESLGPSELLNPAELLRALWSVVEDWESSSAVDRRVDLAVEEAVEEINDELRDAELRADQEEERAEDFKAKLALVQAALDVAEIEILRLRELLDRQSP